MVCRWGKWVVAANDFGIGDCNEEEEEEEEEEKQEGGRSTLGGHFDEEVLLIPPLFPPALFCNHQHPLQAVYVPK
ncbi:hypothetical protein ACRE_003740 [Hapsidospora chrysogenum ATCC 11550]|uniref:Uncharacterized protein n=1 Tax=Hapsidospora chrysogenum (strain ATCC 11550 / CBS 779.69 / DSM 880 / IAM 14645 / JCM 23072 / IMI 49137) TaxID=857340 RepID=A0A086TGV5_HAPC1|nr:hypothetical protein ACRE_003740 [Hapsidospora chrysogenum ATCC 11550]